MSADRDLTPIVRSWLHEDAHEDAARVLDLVLDQLDDIHQRRRLWPAPTFRRVNMSYRLGIAAAVILIAAILGFSYVNHQVGSDQPTPTPTPSGTPVPLPSVGALAPGGYLLANPYLDGNPVRSCSRACADYRWIVFTLPAGWATGDGLVYKHLDQAGEVAFSVWTPDQVYDDPCHWQASTLSPLDLVNHTHDASGIVFLGDRAGGLAHQAGLGVSDLTQLTIGGQVALKVELTVPAQLDLATCDRGEYRSWTEWDVVGGANSHHAPGQIDIVYEVDVDRQSLVIDASHLPGTSASDVAELDAILASMFIDRGEASPTPSVDISPNAAPASQSPGGPSTP